MTDQKKCMDPSTLEIMVTMPDENSDLWGPSDIHHAWKRGHPAGEVKEDEDAMPYVSDGEDSEEEEGKIST
jgi:hypothetical protein